VKLSFVGSSMRRSEVVGIHVDNLTVSIPHSTERSLIERKILICDLFCVTNFVLTIIQGKLFSAELRYCCQLTYKVMPLRPLQVFETLSKLVFLAVGGYLVLVNLKLPVLCKLFCIVYMFICNRMLRFMLSNLCGCLI